MSRKYIRQQIFQDFVYPNNEVSQYDVDDIVQDLNENNVDGLINSFSVSGVTSTGFTLNFDLTWNLNDAEPFIRNSNQLGLWSIHCLAPGQNYYKPWRLIYSNTSLSITATTVTTSVITVISASQLGLNSLPSGTYYFEIRFIGHRSIYPIITTLVINPPTPTPTPTMTPTSTPTMTPTVTPTYTPGPPPTPTPTITPTSGNQLFVYAKYRNSTGELQYSINGGTPVSLGVIDSLSCIYWATITGLNSGDEIVFDSPLTYTVAGSVSSCPNTGFSCSFTYEFVTNDTLYLTIDGSNAC